MVAATKSVANFRQTELGKLARQAHGNLARSGDDTGTLLGKEINYLDAVKVCHSFLYVFHGNLLVLRGQQVFKCFFGELDGYLPFVEASVGLNAVERTFQLADV